MAGKVKAIYRIHDLRFSVTRWIFAATAAAAYSRYLSLVNKQLPFVQRLDEDRKPVGRPFQRMLGHAPSSTDGGWEGVSIVPTKV